MNNFTETKNIGVIRIKEEAQLRYNPLKNLTPQKITAAMDAFNYGYLSQAAKIYDAIRRRDGTVQACVQKRKRATSRLEWTIVEMGNDANASKEQAEFLENFFNNITVSSASEPNMRGSMAMLIDNILSALENKYSVSEIIWHPEDAPKLSAEVRYVPLWFFENTTGFLRFKKRSYDTEGVELEKNGWLIAVNESPLMEATAICYIIKRFAQGDWAACSGRFGMPTPVYNSQAVRGTPEYDSAVEAVANLMNGMGIVTSQGETFDLKLPNGTSEPFKTLFDEMNRQIALIWRGNDLSTLSANNNAGASLQANESEILEDADCALVEETIAHYLTLPALQWRFGESVVPAAYLQLTRKNRKDKLNQIAVYKGATELGCPVAKRDVYETLELREPEENEAITEINTANIGQIQPTSFSNSNEDKDFEDYLTAIDTPQKQKLYSQLERIEELTDEEERRTALLKLQENLAEYFDDADIEANAITKILERRLRNGN